MFLHAIFKHAALPLGCNRTTLPVYLSPSRPPTPPPPPPHALSTFSCLTDEEGGVEPHHPGSVLLVARAPLEALRVAGVGPEMLAARSEEHHRVFVVLGVPTK